MPFVQRTIEPKYLSRKSLFDESGKSLVNDFELEAVTNNTLTNILRQLASVVLVANDIFEDLARQLQDVYERSCKLRTTIDSVEGKLVKCDPKTVTVPESDICTFSLRTIHYTSTHPVTTGLFTATSRPNYLQKLYESSAPTPVHSIRELDRFRQDGTRSSKFFVCTPILGGRRKKYKKIDLEIETRKPVAVEDLRRWTSTEALGDITVLPDNTSKIPEVDVTESGDRDAVDYLLPSPEEQMMAVAMKFPPSIVAVDVSGKPFDRMSGMRRSLTNVETVADGASAKRRTKRRHREKRRNTIAGTSQKEIQQAIAGETTTETDGCEFEPLPPLRSKSTDLFKLPKTSLSPTDNIKNHFNTLKNWSRTKLKFMNRNNSFDSCRPSFQGTDVVDDIGIYETLSSSKHRREKERKQSSSSSAISIPASTASSIATSLVVKLRENSLQRRHWRKNNNKGMDEPAHSSSGNWSASSESGRTSIASETTAPPKSSTTTSSNSLNHHNHHHHHHPPPSVQSRRRYLNASTSSSVSEGTLTPDINEMQYHDLLDGETSSVYSCDTEGYYTSFHVDSGLKTLKEEEIALSFSTLQLQEENNAASTTFNNTSSSGSSTVRTSQLTAENEYELFGKGSTSTTTSSAGTVCTTLPAGNAYGSTRSLSQFPPAVPERKSSLERKVDKKKKTPEANGIELISDSENNDELEATRVVVLIHDSPSPDSGHNTSSSPAESTSQNSHSPHEHLEFSESDIESCDRTERIRNKTAMTTCRIPSLCIITPPQSDDEVNLRNQVPYGLKYVPLNPYATASENAKNVGKVFAQSNGKPLHIQIPKVPVLKKEITDIYAYPNKSKKTKVNTVKTISMKGVLETSLDGVTDDSKNSLHLIVNGETGYATIKNNNEIQKTHRSPSPSGGVMLIKDVVEIPKPTQPALKQSLLPANFMEKFKDVMNKQKKPEKKNDDGDYVMIIDKQKSPKIDPKHSKEEKSEYVSLNELPPSKNPENPLQPSSNESSLERRKRHGARVTLDSDGKVVYSSDSLKRKKEHSTFIPGKYVRESPTPSPLLDKRISKPIRPVNCSGLIRTNSDDQKAEMLPQIGKLIIKAGAKSCDSPTKDFIRMPPTRVVTPTNTPKRNERGARVVLENGHRSSSPALSDASSLERRKRTDRCTSPSSSSSSSNETKKPEVDINTEEGLYSPPPRWISQHPAVSKKQQYLSPSGFPRNHPMYWTLPSKTNHDEEIRKDSEFLHGRIARDRNQTSFNNRNRSSQQTGAMEPTYGLTSLRLVQNIQKNEFTSSTPTKASPPDSKNANLGNGMSPILKETLFKSKMTAEEIFAAIHKSKKKLNIKDDVENASDSPSSSSLSPDSSECSPGMKTRDRSSWSPNSCDLDVKNEARTRKSWTGSATPINSFKKLLLQQGIKNPKDFKISAVEQLKLSKENTKAENKTPSRATAAAASNIRSRIPWRYNSPRTDVLSSTIPEDCSEAEKSDDSKQKDGPRFGPTQRLERENLSADLHDSKCEGSKPRENRSLEITKKYLQQARRNFFSELPNPNNVGLPTPARKQLNFSGANGFMTKRPSESIFTSPDCAREKNFQSSSEKKKGPIISLETAL